MKPWVLQVMFMFMLSPPLHDIAMRPDGLVLVKVIHEKIHLPRDAQDPRVHVDAELVGVPDGPHLVAEHEHDGAGDGHAEHGQYGGELGDFVADGGGTGVVDEHFAVFDREDNDHDPAGDMDDPEEYDGNDVCKRVCLTFSPESAECVDILPCLMSVMFH